MEGVPTQYRIPKWSRRRTRVLVIHAENFPRVEMSAYKCFLKDSGKQNTVSKLKVSLSAREWKFHNTERLKIQFLDHNHMFLLVIQIQILRLKDELFWRSRLGFDCIED